MILVSNSLYCSRMVILSFIKWNLIIRILHDVCSLFIDLNVIVTYWILEHYLTVPWHCLELLMSVLLLLIYCHSFYNKIISIISVLNLCSYFCICASWILWLSVRGTLNKKYKETKNGNYLCTEYLTDWENW